MTATLIPPLEETKPFTTRTMRATVFHGPGDIRVEDVPRPHAGPGEALIRVTTTTICGTDLHIVKGEYPVRPGLVIGHEPVGVIAELGAGVAGYNVGDRVLVGAITPCGQCNACLSGHHSQCGHGNDCEALGGWRFGNTIDGAQAEYLLVPNAQANMAVIPDELPAELTTNRSSSWPTSPRPASVAPNPARSPSATRWRSSRRVRSASAPPSVHACSARRWSSASMATTPASPWRRRWASTWCSTIARSMLSPRSAVSLAAGSTSRSRRSGRSRRSKTRCASSVRAARSPASASTRASWRSSYDAFGAGLADVRIITTLCPGGKERLRRLLDMVRSGRLGSTV